MCPVECQALSGVLFRKELCFPHLPGYASCPPHGSSLAQHPSLACFMVSAHSTICWSGELPWSLPLVTLLSYSKPFNIAFSSVRSKPRWPILSQLHVHLLMLLKLTSIQWLDLPFPESLLLATLYPREYSFCLRPPMFTFYPDEVSHPLQHCL